MPSIDLIKASDGSGDASIATVQSTRSPDASTIEVDTVQGINDKFSGAMGTPHTFIDPVTSEEITIISQETCVEFQGHVDAGNLEIDTIAPGYTDAGSAVGDIVVIRPTTQWADELASILEVSHEDDGSPKPVSLNPSGIVSPYAGSSAPSGWLLCDGSSKLRADYPDLFAVIGTTFGSVDGTHFTLPDLRSRFPVGVGTGQFTFSFASTDVNTSTDQITVTASPELKTGRKIRLTTTGTLPTGLALATDYYLIVIDSTHIKLATSEANALAGTAIDITAQGSGTNTATNTLDTYALGDHGGAQKHSHPLSSIGQALVYITTGVIELLRVSASSWNPSHKVTATNSSAGGAQSVGTSLAGNTDFYSTVPPYLALNYIIKT